MSLQSLPTEIQLEILLLPSRSDLIQFCSISSTFRSLCSEAYFWKRKFKQDNLLLLEEGSSFSTWYALCHSGVVARDLAKARVDTDEETVISLDRVKQDNLFLYPSVPAQVYYRYLSISRGEHYPQDREDLDKLKTDLSEIDLEALSEEEWEEIKDNLTSLTRLVEVNKDNLAVELILSKQGYSLLVLGFLSDCDWHLIKSDYYKITPKENYELVYKAFYYGLMEKRSLLGR